MRLLLLVFLAGCGVGEGVRSASPDAGKTPTDASFVVDAAPDVTPVVVPCEAGTERIEVTGATTLTAGCGDAGGPPIARVGGGEDCWNLNVSGCGGAASFSLLAGGCAWHGPGETNAEGITFDDGAGGVVQTYGPVTVDDWPDAGDLVSGSFSSWPEAPAIQGVFCVRRLR